MGRARPGRRWGSAQGATALTTRQIGPLLGCWQVWGLWCASPEERAVIVPLRPNSENADRALIGQAENVAVGRLWVHAVRRVDLSSTKVCTDLHLSCARAWVHERVRVRETDGMRTVHGCTYTR